MLKGPNFTPNFALNVSFYVCVWKWSLILNKSEAPNLKELINLSPQISPK
jgi:hypothetical protein